MRAGRLGALEERQFRLLFLGQAATALGDRMSQLALPFAVLAITTSASALGVVLACATVSMVVFLIAGGVVADRLSRRRVMVAADLVHGCAQAATAALLIGGHAQVWQLAALQAVNGAASAFFIPAQQGLIPETVSPHRLQQANALMSLSRNLTGIGGPALAGLLVAAAGPGWAIAVDAATFLASAAFVAQLRLPATVRERTSFAADLRAGWAEFASRTWVWASVANFALFQLIALSAWVVLGPYVAKTELGGATAWAIILVAGSAGAIAGGILSLRRRPRRPGVVMFVMVALSAPPLALLAVPAPVILIAAAAVISSGAMSVFNALWFTALQERIPEHARSRVSSYDWLGSVMFFPVGMALVGSVAQAVGVTTTLVAAAVWTLGASLFMTLLPSIRALHRDDGLAKEAAVPARAS